MPGAVMGEQLGHGSECQPGKAGCGWLQALEAQQPVEARPAPGQVQQHQQIEGKRERQYQRQPAGRIPDP